jgi:hypothetical protein
MKPFLLCVLLGMSPAHVAHVSYVFKSQSVEFAKGQTFACVKGKEEQTEILIERDLSKRPDTGKKTNKGGRE